MAPKKPPEPKKPEEPQKGKGEDREGKKSLIESERFGKVAKVAVFIFFFLSILMICLYFFEKFREWNIKQSVRILREFSIEYDPKYETADDFEVIAVAQNLTSELIVWNGYVKEIQKEIETIVKSTDRWLAFERNLYHFSDDRFDRKEAIEQCKEKGAELFAPNHTEEEEFLEGTVTRLGDNFWIGLDIIDYLKDKVKWINGATVETIRWNKKKYSIVQEKCVFLAGAGKVRESWEDAECSKQYRYVCKKFPNQRFYY